MAIIVNSFDDYECIDCGDKEKLERWGKYILRRPDTQCIWGKGEDALWNKPDGFYHRSSTGGGFWEYKNKPIEAFNIKYRDLKFKITPTNFKHTGLFPEQKANWDFAYDLIKGKENINVLNLFAYTGAMSSVCSKAGADMVVHVDASKGINEWAKENMVINNLEGNKMRFIVDDAIKFVEREHRRGNKYQALIMDPPSYGRGPNKDMWKIEDNLLELIEKCINILDDNFLFFIINVYNSTITEMLLNNILKETIIKKFPKYKLETNELCLQITKRDIVLPCGITGRIYKND